MSDCLKGCRRVWTDRVRKSLLNALGNVLLDADGDGRLVLGVDGVGLVGRHCWFGWFVLGGVL